LTPKWRVITIASLLAIVLIIVWVCFQSARNDDQKISQKYALSIKVSVQNGCGFTGVASHIRRSLADKSVDVISTGNARKFIYEETIIVVKLDEPDELKRLQSITGIKNVIYAENSNYPVPFIIIAGRDYQNYFK